MFWLFGSSSEHAPANIGRTLNHLLLHMIKHKTHEFIVGRNATMLPDVMEIGLTKCKPDMSVDLQRTKQHTTEKVQETNQDIVMGDDGEDEDMTDEPDLEDNGEDGWPVDEEEIVNEDDLDIE
jgi:hypothetical protein